MTLLSDRKNEIPDKWRCQKRWNNANQEARRAHRAVAAALRAGTLKRGQCEVCGSFRAEAHHDRYDAPLDVRWFCRAHHRQLHAARRKAVAA
jgi:hypothetical protein